MLQEGAILGWRDVRQRATLGWRHRKGAKYSIGRGYNNVVQVQGHRRNTGQWGYTLGWRSDGAAGWDSMNTKEV